MNKLNQINVYLIYDFSACQTCFIQATVHLKNKGNYFQGL